MKHSNPAALVAALITTCFLAVPAIHAQSAPRPAPTGWLTTNSDMIRAGAKPVLQWDITYPTIVEDFVDVDDHSVTPNQPLDMEIRVLGAGVTASNADGSNLRFVPTEALFSYDHGSYQRIFFGTNHEVDPGRIVHSRTVTPGKTLRFGGRYFFNGAWGPYFHSDSGTNNVRTLVDGDFPPTTYPLHTAPTLENFLKPYLDASGRVNIGPMDVIVFMELTHTDAQSTHQGYDCQDMVLLVTFKTKNNK
jgi:hypothetical protein